MEKHADFLRDFRGDTVHASTLRLLDELGLTDEFAQMPHREIDSLNINIQGTEVSIDLGRIHGPHKHIALVPQWDFLELLAAAAAKEPTFRLLRSTEVLGPIIRAGVRKDRVIGVSYRDSEGQARELHADLTVACDGRSSTLRTAMGLTPRSFGAPMDVWWFRLPRNPDDPHGLAGVLGAGHACIAIDRRDYFQIAYVIPKGRDAQLRAQGIETLHRGVVALVPWLAGRVEAVTSFNDVKLLDVQLNRLRRWYTDGLRVIHTRVIAVAVLAGQPIKPPLLVRVANRVRALRTVAGYAVAIGPLPEHVPEFARR
jgi:2-polyprenyl-6-methoxyphenol hydroxylase-like FAD-dependent oxidoreductase